MATAKKNTAGRKARVKADPEWVVPVEAIVTGYVVVQAPDPDSAYEVVEEMISAKEFGTLDNKQVDLNDFQKMVTKGDVRSALPLEDPIVKSKKRREPAKNRKAAPKKSTTTAKKSTAKKAPAKGRTRGAAPKKAATNPKTGTKAAPKKAPAKKTPAKAGRRRGSATS